jgi:ubiquitin carboxyl-terminal hydrolase 8
LTVSDALDTAFVASRGGWMYCDDSSVKHVDPKQVVVSFFAADAILRDADSIFIKQGQKAYVLFYKRVRLDYH